MPKPRSTLFLSVKRGEGTWRNAEGELVPYEPRVFEQRKDVRHLEDYLTKGERFIEKRKREIRRNMLMKKFIEPLLPQISEEFRMARSLNIKN